MKKQNNERDIDIAPPDKTENFIRGSKKLNYSSG
jgi:hypothetical protein